MDRMEARGSGEHTCVSALVAEHILRLRYEMLLIPPNKFLIISVGKGFGDFSLCEGASQQRLMG